ncbi:very short patch repair endonuclease [Sulfuriferula sp. AH1]|uniref:very short patch repair endonuclease n=1 Tax=Sulfuriferula sp. AH1 TaxID=1985873 RepID=UPI000B3B5437|nr:very short patch repair endonuclease [Sulfuriferula sp. AH1]ARU31746.1 very short patch repair endonuclease [Sulfuriferula sp. AH1]
MVDIVDSATRSRMMAGIKGKNTKPELLVRKYLHSRGLRFRLHAKELPGKPDLVFPKYKTVVFVHGCFWHQHPRCKLAVMPGSNIEFWKQKLGANRERDQRNKKMLKALGWRILTVWECQLNDRYLSGLAGKIIAKDKEVNAESTTR